MSSRLSGGDSTHMCAQLAFRLSAARRWPTGLPPPVLAAPEAQDQSGHESDCKGDVVGKDGQERLPGALQGVRFQQRIDPPLHLVPVDGHEPEIGEKLDRHEEQANDYRYELADLLQRITRKESGNRTE